MNVVLLRILCVLSGRGLCDELLTHTEESYRLWCVIVCDLERSWMRRPWPNNGLSHQNKKWSYETNMWTIKDVFPLFFTKHCFVNWNIRKLKCIHYRNVSTEPMGNLSRTSCHSRSIICEIAGLIANYKDSTREIEKQKQKKNQNKSKSQTIKNMTTKILLWNSQNARRNCLIIKKRYTHLFGAKSHLQGNRGSKLSFVLTVHKQRQPGRENYVVTDVL
jgi:hypothetical protein